MLQHKILKLCNVLRLNLDSTKVVQQVSQQHGLGDPIAFRKTSKRWMKLAICLLLPSMGCVEMETEKLCTPRQKTVYTGPTRNPGTIETWDRHDNTEVYRLARGEFGGVSAPGELFIHYYRPVTAELGLSVRISGELSNLHDLQADFPSYPEAHTGSTFSSTTTYAYSNTNGVWTYSDPKNRATIAISTDYYAIPREFSMHGTGAVAFNFTAQWAAGTTTVVVPCSE